MSMLSPCFKGHRIVLPGLGFAHHYYRQKGFLPKRRKPIFHPSQGIRLCRFLCETKVGERGGGYQNHQSGISSGQQIKA